MAFLLRVLSGGERFKERAQDVEQLRKEFNLKKEEVSSALLHNDEVRSLVEMIFDGSYPEAQHYLKSPSQQWLKANREVVWRILSSLTSQDVPFISRLRDVIQKHGVEPVCDVVLELLKLISQLLVNKDIKGGLLESIDFGWHKGSPLSGKLSISSFKNSHQQTSFSKDFETLQPVEINSSSGKRDGTKDIVCCARYMDEGSSMFSEAPKDEKSLSLSERDISSCKLSDESTVEEHEKSKDVSESNRSRPWKELDCPIMKVEIAHAYPQTEENQVIGNLGRTSGPEAAVTRSTSGQFCSSEFSNQRSANSSLIHSRRMSFTGSEPSYSQYTTDSDDDSLSTSSQVSLLVAVSEAPESDSSVDDFDLKSAEAETNGQMDRTETCSDPAAQKLRSDSIPSAESAPGVGDDKREHASADALDTASSENSDVVITELCNVGDELAQDKLPISSSVVLSGRNSGSDNGLSETSFYAPEMWTYSEKDASAFEGAFNGNQGMKPEEQRPLEHVEDPGEGAVEQEKEMLEEDKVMVATSVEDKYVSVSVQAVFPMKDSDTSSLKRGKLQVSEKWDHSDGATQKTSVKGLEENAEVNNVIISETDGMDKQLSAEKTDERKCMTAEGALQVAPPEEDLIVESSGGKDDDLAEASSSICDEEKVPVQEPSVAEEEGVSCSVLSNREEVPARQSERAEAPEAAHSEEGEDLTVGKSSEEGEDLTVGKPSEEGEELNVGKASEEAEHFTAGKSSKEAKHGVLAVGSLSTQDEEQSSEEGEDLIVGKSSEEGEELNVGKSSEEGEHLTVGKSSKKGKHGDLAVGSLSTQDEEQVPTISSPFSSNLEDVAADEKLDLLTDVENSITEKSEAAKAPEAVQCFGRSGDGSEPLPIPHSGLIPLSGPIYSSPIPYSGSLSLRSDSSTNSTRSFAFPILSADWNSSPVKMAPPDRRYFRRRHGWRGFCCFCCTKSAAYH